MELNPGLYVVKCLIEVKELLENSGTVHEDCITEVVNVEMVHTKLLQ